MSESNRALQEFVSFLGSPDMYGSMSMAAGIMKWFVHLVVTILMIAAVIAVLFVVLKFAADVIFLSGAGHLMKGNAKLEKGMAKVEAFASEHAVNVDIKNYIAKDIWKSVITLAFIGLLATGMILPLAAQVAGMIGAGIDKLLGLDPATQIANFNVKEFNDSVKYTRPKDLKQQYDKALSAATAYREQIYTLGTKGAAGNKETIDRYKVLYTGEMMKAEALAVQLRKTNTELKLPKTYFDQHKKVCSGTFMDNATKSAFTGVALTCK